MKRRTALRAVTGAIATSLGGCLGSVPSASGPRHAPNPPAGEPRRTPARPDLVVGTFDFEATDAGTLRVVGTVENHSEAERTATVRVTAGIGDEDRIEETSVAVPAGETAEWAVTFDVAYERFASGGDLSVDLV